MMIVKNIASCMVIMLFAVAAMADVIPPWFVENDQLIVTGEVDFAEVEIPAGVKWVNPNSFKDCKAIERVNCPESLVGILAFAFSGCENLAEVHFSDEMEMILSGAFADCKSLTSVELPNGLEIISAEVFMGCTSLKEAILPNSITNIAARAFANCGALTRVYVHKDAVYSVHPQAFDGCPSCLEIIEIDQSPRELPWKDISLDANGGEVGESVVRTVVGYKCGLLPEPRRDGYAFDGWWTAASGGSQIESTTVIDKKAVPEALYAHWRQMEAMQFYAGGDGGAVWTQISDDVWRGELTNGGRRAWLRLLVSGEGEISFAWKFSRLNNVHNMIFSIDGATNDTLSLEYVWTNSTNTIATSGQHTLEWVFERSENEDYSEIYGLVSNIMWTAAAESNIPELSDDANADDVAKAVASCGFADEENIAAMIGGDAGKYVKFREWANGVEGGVAAVGKSQYAAVSYLLGAAKPFLGKPCMKIGKCAVLPVGGAERDRISLSVEFLEGSERHEVSAESVKALIRLTSDIGDWEGDGLIDFDAVVTSESEMSAEHSFTIVPKTDAKKGVFMRLETSPR